MGLSKPTGPCFNAHYEMAGVRLRLPELLPLAFFTYTVFLGWSWDLETAQLRSLVLVAVLAGFMTWAFAWAELHWRPRLFNIARDWLPLALVPVAYIEMANFTVSEGPTVYEHSWLAWDRMVLDAWGLRRIIESLGPVIPALLEVCYALIYALPGTALAILYFERKRDRVDQFLFTFVGGCLITYSLFPLFPSQPPRFVFPGEDLPGVHTVFREFNLWWLERANIWTSVFPSGHVTAAFGVALGLRRALPERPWLGRAFLAMAFAVWVATFYGRYHYLVDGLAGMAVSLLSARWTARLARRGYFAQPELLPEALPALEPQGETRRLV